MGDLAVSIYSGHGNIILVDYVTTSNELARAGSLLSTEISKAYAVDVTFILAAGTPIVRIRFDLKSRGGAYLIDQSYAFQGAIDFERTSMAPRPLVWKSPLKIAGRIEPRGHVGMWAGCI
jgi:hypothetical protein